MGKVDLATSDQDWVASDFWLVGGSVVDDSKAPHRRDHRTLVIGVAFWLAALAVIAIGIGLGALGVSTCADDSSCSDDDFFGLVASAVGISLLLLWPAVACLVRWRSASRIAAGWRGLLAAVLLMVYAQAATRFYFSDSIDQDLLGVSVGILLLAGWFAFGVWLVSRIRGADRAGIGHRG